MSARGTALAIAYVGAVGLLAGLAFARPDQGFSVIEAIALVLVLPTVVVALPLIYVGGSTAWNLTGADHGGPMWPVTVVYVVMFAATATANVALFVLLRRLVRRPTAAG